MLDSSYEKTFAISNTGNCSLAIDSVISSDSALFKIVSPAFPQNINPGDSILVVVQFSPHDTGSTEGELRIYSNALNKPVTQVHLIAKVFGIFEDLPHLFKFSGGKPNPFVARTIITYSIPREVRVRLMVYDLTGRCVNTLVDGCKKPGRYTIIWQASDKSGKRLPPGIYFYVFEAGDYRAVRKAVLMK